MTIMPSGRLVSRDNDVVPTYADIANNLCRQIRFGGSSAIPYTVMQHTFVVAAHVPPHMRAFALLHDAVEAITGDVPRPVKHAEQSMLEMDFTERISRSFGLPWPWPQDITEAVHAADLMAACAEALFLFGDECREWCDPWHEPTVAMLRDTKQMLPYSRIWIADPTPAIDSFRKNLKIGLETWKEFATNG